MMDRLHVKSKSALQVHRHDESKSRVLHLRALIATSNHSEVAAD